MKKPKRACPLVPLTQNVKAHKSNVAVQCSLLTPAADRDAMKEAFQRDIDDTVASTLAEDVDSTIIRGLSFDGKVETHRGIIQYYSTFCIKSFLLIVGIQLW